jgi:hypothetical protein
MSALRQMICAPSGRPRTDRSAPGTARLRPLSVQAGQNPAGLAAEIRKLTTEAFELLEQGLRDYAAKPASTTGQPGDPASR